MNINLMDFQPENIYHVYNRGNNKDIILFENRNYIYFIDKLKKQICKYADLLAYCLMPNHFHLLLFTRKENEPGILNNEIAVLLRSYTRAINLQENRVGSLFQQKTKAKKVHSYGIVCLNYIHQNPYNAGLVSKLEDWEFSSFNEYLGTSHNSICNIELAAKLLELPKKDEFYKMSYETVKRDFLENIF